MSNNNVRIVHNKILGGFFVVRGVHQSPISGRFDSKAEARASLKAQKTEAGRVANHSTKTIQQARTLSAEEQATLDAEMAAIKARIGYRPHTRAARA